MYTRSRILHCQELVLFPSHQVAPGLTEPSPERNSAPAAPLVAAHGIGVRRGGRWLIRNVDLTIHRAEIVTLIGPNGAGKTTTAKALLGLHGIDEGRLEFADRGMPGADGGTGTGLRVGYVPQHLSIDSTLPLTVRRLMTLTQNFADHDIEIALGEVGVASLADKAMQQLSGGELQRVLLARALIRKPDLLVLDEPVQGVDFAGEIALYELIADIRDRLGCGILLISHDLHMVMARSDTVVCLNQHVCCSGSPLSVASDPEYRRLFGASAAEALAIYRHDHDHAHGPDGRVIPLGNTPPTNEGAATLAERDGDA